MTLVGPRWASPAASAAPRAAVAPCTAEAGEPVAVASITPGLDVVLEDGRTVRLAGIDPVRASPQQDLSAAAQARLDAWLTGHAATLQGGGSAVDRWGRVPALLFAPAPGAAAGAAPLSVGEALVDAGLARAWPDGIARACWARLLATEDAARAAGLGLWADPHYALRRGDDAAGLRQAMGALAVVEGRIAHVGRSRAIVYLDLGQPHVALALRLTRRAAFILDQLGLGQDNAKGSVVRARGYLEDRGGPSIEIVDRDQIEIVARPAGPAEK